jgi:hypothetical protein
MSKSSQLSQIYFDLVKQSSKIASVEKVFGCFKICSETKRIAPQKENKKNISAKRKNLQLKVQVPNRLPICCQSAESIVLTTRRISQWGVK